MKLKWDRPSPNPNEFRTQKVVGLPGFEPGSIEPKSTSLDQASRQPRVGSGKHNLACAIKTLANPEKPSIPETLWASQLTQYSGICG